jgi:hypothetical protein
MPLSSVRRPLSRNYTRQTLTGTASAQLQFSTCAPFRLRAVTCELPFGRFVLTSGDRINAAAVPHLNCDSLNTSSLAALAVNTRDVLHQRPLLSKLSRHENKSAAVPNQRLPPPQP